jgi:hypothetical protein
MSPKGATVGSIPDISFVPFQIVPPQELAELILKRHGAMVSFLVRQIRFNLIDVGIADGEGAVTVLPLKFRKPQFAVSPGRRIGFYESDGVGNCQCASERDQ